MKELKEILRKIDELAPDEKGVLATVVDVRGSSYRLPGAKMLILESGETFGTISGGCLETDVLERARKVLQTDEASVFTYDTTQDENSVFSLNMGCRGVIRILLEPILSLNRYFEFLERFWLNSLTSVVVATLISAPKGLNNKVGSKLMFAPNFVFQNDFDDLFQKRILEIVEKTAFDKKSRVEEVSEAEIFFEFIPSQICLFIFGAGADAIPLSILGKNLGWRVDISDHRPAFAAKERFPTADSVNVLRPEDFGGFTPSTGNYAAVVMSHNYEHDKVMIWRLLNTNAFYIGALGPKRRTEQILQELSAEEKQFPDENLSKLFAPVGLDIGGETPEAIALAITAEIQSVLGRREGGFLRARKGSIYGRNE